MEVDHVIALRVQNLPNFSTLKEGKAALVGGEWRESAHSRNKTVTGNPRLVGIP